MQNTRPTERVGVIGVGHLALQFATNFGCKVVFLSGTDNKKEEAVKLGVR